MNCRCSELYRAIATQALWELYVRGWSPDIRDTLERNGTRARWWRAYGDEIETMLGRLGIE